MVLSLGTLLSEISASSDTSAVARLLPFVLFAFAVLAVAAVVLGIRNAGRSGRDDDETAPPPD